MPAPTSAASEALTFQPVWTAAGVVSGFVVTAFIFRIKREAEMRSDGRPYWLTAADHVLILSLVVGLVGVFVLPVLGADLTVARYALGWSMLLLAGYPLVAAGHYEILLGHPPARRGAVRGERDEHAAAQRQDAEQRRRTVQHRSAAPGTPRGAEDGSAVSAREAVRVSRQELWCVALLAAVSVAYWAAVAVREAG